MAISLTPIEVTDNFQVLIDRTNEIITELQQRVVTASPAGNTTTGNAILVGNMFANNFTANLASGTFEGFTAKISEIRQVSGNTSPIGVYDMLSLTAANSAPLRITNAVGPKIKLATPNSEWDFGVSGGASNAALTWAFGGSTQATLSHAGALTLEGGITATGNGIFAGGIVRTANGSAAAPAHSFNSEGDTGFYISATNELSISTDGTQRARFTGNGNFAMSGGDIYSSNGVVGSPTYSFLSDQDTGLWSAGANQLAISTGGAERLRFNVANVDITSNILNFATYADFNVTTNTGIRVGRNGLFSRISLHQANTATQLIQLVADEVGSNTSGQIRVHNTAGAAYPAYSFRDDQNTGFDNLTADSIGIALGGAYHISANTTKLSSNIGLAFGSTTAASANTISRHIDLWGGQYGLSVTGSSYNLVAPASGVFRFINAANSDVSWEIFNNNGVACMRGGLGTVGLPAYSFIDDPNTGLYGISADLLGITAGGVERVRIGSTALIANVQIIATDFAANAGGQFKSAADSAAAPGFTWGADLTTGIYRNAASSIAFSAAGAARATISTTGLRMYSDGVIHAETGSAAAPSLHFGNSETGLYYAGATTVGISGGGVASFYASETYCRSLTGHRFLSGSAAAPGINWASDTNTGLFLSTYTHFSHAGTTAARIEVNDTAALASTTVMTRTKGDTRYVNESSIRYKDKVGIIPQSELSKKLLAAFDAFDLTSWVWGKAIDEKNVKYGTVGIGIIAEKVEEYLPEAVKYRWKSKDGEEDIGGKKEANALDPMPIIASLIEKIRQLEARLEAVEG